MKPRLLFAMAALLVLTACHSKDKGQELEEWATEAYLWTQEVNTVLEERAANYAEVRNAIQIICEKAGIVEAECPLPPGDTEDPPLNRPPAYPPN